MDKPRSKTREENIHEYMVALAANPYVVDNYGTEQIARLAVELLQWEHRILIAQRQPVDPYAD